MAKWNQTVTKKIKMLQRLSLNNDKILRIWELAGQQHPVDQAITILQEAFPDKIWDDLIRLSIGERNSFLLDIREQTFGKGLHGATKCAKCGKELEFIADADELRCGVDGKKEKDTEAIFGQYKIRLRMLNSLDLAAVAECSDIDSAGRIMARRAVLQLFLNEIETSVDNLSDDGLVAISEKLEKSDPHANMKIEMKCPECGAILSIPFDIASFLWKEIAAQAKRLLREVNILAGYYGWREGDILSMSSIRRHFYLEMAES